MRRLFLRLAICAGLISPLTMNASEVWKEMNRNQAPKEVQLIHPDVYRIYRLDEKTLGLQFSNLSSDPASGEIVALPMPDGSSRDFRVWATSMMPESLANQYPEIRTYTATALDDATVTAKLDFTLYGFHAMVYDGENTCYIDPFDNFHDGYYIAYYKKDLSRAVDQRMVCSQHGTDDNGPAGEPMATAQTGLPKLAYKTVNGYSLRTYRLALACSSQYATASTGIASPTKAQVLSKMTTSMNRVNGIYEREFSITTVFAAGENAVIFTTSAGDPYFGINNSAPACLTENVTQCNALIGFTNYDIGHVFTTGSGGQASLGCVCTFGKAQGTTGQPSPVGDAFDVDYVAHEMGHQFGATHTFNNGIHGSCGGGNAESSSAYEPGSGSTILAYAGICSPDNVQTHSDPYFHRKSIEQVIALINSTANCAANTPTSNKLVKYNAFSPTSYNIPYLTPFELTAPTAVDSAGDSVVLYAWEEDDLNATDFGKTFATTTVGPIFRSINPSKSSTRVFPKISSVLAGNLNTAYEKSPTVARDMKFKCIYRNIRNNKGCVTIPDEVITVSAKTTGSGAGFKVTSQSAAGDNYTGGSTQTVTWTVLNTDVAPISAANVDIWMSQNGGTTYQYFVGTFPNNGSASIVVPNPAATTTTARFKVKGNGNVFFNVNSANFTVQNNPSLPISYNSASTVSAPENDIKIFPVPASDALHITATFTTNASVYNVIGQEVWTGSIKGATEINVSAWARGMYYVRFVNATNGLQTVKQVIVQ